MLHLSLHRHRPATERERDTDGGVPVIIYISGSACQQEVFTHRHDRHQTSVIRAVTRVVEMRWLVKKKKL